MNNFRILIFLTTLISIAFGQGSDFRKKRINKVQVSPKLNIEITKASTATFKGKILDEQSAESLMGVKIAIEGTNKGTFSDIDGLFKIDSLPAGTYNIILSYIGYSTKKIEKVEMVAGQVTTINLVMQEQPITTEEVVITTTLERESDVSALKEQIASFSIKDVFASESILRASSDLLLSNSLSRLPGVNLIEDQYLVIRGLSERYNVFTLNGAPLPITNINRQTFEFGTLPTNVISQLKLLKSGSADALGGFSGGIVEIETPEFIDKRTININVQALYNTKSSFVDFYHHPLAKNGLGSLFVKPNGLSSDFPSIQQATSIMPDDPANASLAIKAPRDVTPKISNSLPGYNIAFSYKNKIKFGDNKYWNFIVGGSALNRNSYEDRTLYVIQQFDPSLGYSLAADSGGWKYYETQTAANAYFNTSFNFNERHKISFFNLANFLVNDIYGINNGRYISNPITDERSMYLFTPQKFTKRNFYSTQLSGKHKFAINEKRNLGLNWTLFGTFSKYVEPNTRAMNFILQDSIPDRMVYDTSIENEYRVFDETFDGTQKDNLVGLKTDIDIPFEKNSILTLIKTGFLASLQNRDFYSRKYGFIASDSFNLNLRELDYQNIGQIYGNNANFGPNGFYFKEVTTYKSSYQAFSINIAPYALANFKFSPKFTAQAGIRGEYFSTKVENRKFGSDVGFIDTTIFDPLPSLGLKLNFGEKTATKLSLFESIIRPEARELSEFVYFDLFMSSNFQGNSRLIRSKVYNFDWRFEFIPTGREIISASVFYKYIDNPIEQFIQEGTVDVIQTYSVRNLNRAMVAGVELDVRKRLGFLGSPYFDNFLVTTNFTFAHSRVNVSFDKFFKKEGRALQGQATYTANLGLVFTEPKTRFDFGFFYITTGYKISIVGLGEGVFPDLIELPRHVIDLQLGKKFGQKFELKFVAQDILNQPFQRVQIYEGRKTYNPIKDNIVYKFQKGNRFMLSLTCKL